MAIPPLFCLGALLSPFSVAATNAALGLAILLSFLSGQLLYGIRIMHQQYPLALYAIAAYLTLMLLGLLWSNDIIRGLRIISHQWLWLIIPTLLAAFVADHRLRHRFWTALSIGLVLHLGFCAVQMSGWHNMQIMAGSSPSDATGYIGHIGFGFVYGIWAGWLLHWGYLNKTSYMRWVAWALALWALFMIFAAQGRSGYLVTIAILIFLVWTHFIKGRKLSIIIITVVLILGLGSISLSNNIGHSRIKQTFHNIQLVLNGDFERVEEEERIQLWINAIHIWQEYPIIGVGTGGYNPITRDGQTFHSPHQFYLLSLLRWGPIGLSFVIILLISLYRSHSKLSVNDQDPTTDISYQIVGKMAVIALAVHGLTSSALEAHAAMIMATFAISAAMYTNKLQPKNLNSVTQSKFTA